MVVSEQFLWLHIPKTAGDATLLMFRQLDHPWRLIDPHTDPRKHSTLAEAWERVPGASELRVIANLRRLPDVALSYFHHMQRHSPGERFANGRAFGELTFREYIRGVVERPDTQSYDWILNHYLGERDADQWLRVSNLAQSFIEVVGAYVPISEEARDRIRSISANVGSYAREDRWYEPGVLTKLYANCPRWTETERRVYGDILREQAA